MARKLLVVVALISLVLLIQVAPGLAVTTTTYILEAGDYSWTETHGNDKNGNAYPGSPDSQLNGSFTSADGTTWRIGDQYWKTIVPTDPPVLSPANLLNSAQAKSVDLGNNTFTFMTVYDSVESPGTIKFSAHITNGPDISSIDAKITMTETFKFQEGDGSLQWTFQYGTIAGSGTSNGIPFTLSGTLYENMGDHTHYGGITDFTLTYPAAAHAPIPGAVWLLGTGLLGLAGVGRRRKA
jgi:hypothetical protein